MTRSSLPFLVLLLLTLASCAKPTGDYLFMSAQTAGERGGHYEFQLRMDDSTCRYDAFLAARVVTSRIPGSSLSLDIRTVSPSGETAIERLQLPLGDPSAAQITLGSGSQADYQWPWRSFNPTSAESGLWQVSVTPTDPETAAAFYGIGLSYKGTPWAKEN